MRVVNRLFDTQYRSETDVASLEQTTPMVAGIACEQLRESCLQAAPLIEIVLRGWIDVVELQFFQKQSVKLRFQRPDCDEPAVRANVGVIEWRIVKRARQGPIDLAVGTNLLQDSTEHCDDIDDGGVRAR